MSSNDHMRGLISKAILACVVIELLVPTFFIALGKATREMSPYLLAYTCISVLVFLPITLYYFGAKVQDITHAIVRIIQKILDKLFRLF